MLQEIFATQLRDDFRKGLKKIATKNNLQPENIQVRVMLPQDETGLRYSLHDNWKCFQKESSFKEVLGIGLDVFGKKDMVEPLIYEVLLKEATKYETQDVSAFLFDRNNSICVSIHNGKEFVQTSPLVDLFQKE